MSRPSAPRRWATFAIVLLGHCVPALGDSAADELPALHRYFQTSDRCFPCHNGLTSPAGEDVSIGLDWGASIMANSARDPYWQASVRRETIDHVPATAAIEDECSVCHMPMVRFAAHSRGQLGRIFTHLPFNPRHQEEPYAVDGVSCSVCHQVTNQNLGQPASFNGGFDIAPPSFSDIHPEYGPFDISGGRMRIMSSSTGGFQPNGADQIRSPELCATCHTLITQARGDDGRVVGALPEQMPYQEWQHSDYASQRTCQGCHMPEVRGPTLIARVLGEPRQGMHRHVFVAANFFLQRLLAAHSGELEVSEPVDRMQRAADSTIAYLQSQSAQVRIDGITQQAGRLTADVSVLNLGGHKLPTAFPSRRVWLHLRVTDRLGQVLFESGALRDDGSIVGNDNDEDPARFEPHYREIRRADQVQIYEDILGDAQGQVTTGILAAVCYLKDNRLLPQGFDKHTAVADIAVIGAAASDDGFEGGQHRLRYSIDVGSAMPAEVRLELWYQPIGFRWAHNLDAYRSAPEPRRFTDYFDSAGASSAVMIASAVKRLR